MMRKVLLLIFLLGTSCALKAQLAIGERRHFVEHSSMFFSKKYAATSKIASTDSTYSIMLRGEIESVDEYFVFDKDGKCKFQSFQFECDTCCAKLFKLLHRRIIGWKPVSPNTYWAWATNISMTYDSVHNNVTLQRLDYDRHVYSKVFKQKVQEYKAIAGKYYTSPK